MPRVFKLKDTPANRRAAPAVFARRRKVLPRKKATTRLIKQVLNRQLETKYTAQQLGNNGTGGPSFTVNWQCSPNTDAYRVIPQVLQQTTPASSNVREGDEIKPTMLRVSGHVWLGGERSVPSLDIYVKMWILTAKETKTYAPQTGAFPNNFPGGFLENGGANPVDWQAPAQDLQAFFPISKDNYTLLKTKTFRLVKNPGSTIGGTTGDSNDPNIGRDRLKFSFKLNTPQILKYNTDADVYPTNYAPIILITYYTPGVDISSQIALQGMVFWNYNTEMYFKDA